MARVPSGIIVTQLHRKWAKIQGTNGAIEWICGYDMAGDAVRVSCVGQEAELIHIPKTRPEDFIEEFKHIDQHLDEASAVSGLNLERGLDTMLVVAAAHASEKTGRRMTVGYELGYRAEASEVAQ